MNRELLDPFCYKTTLNYKHFNMFYVAISTHLCSILKFTIRIFLKVD